MVGGRVVKMWRDAWLGTEVTGGMACFRAWGR